MIRYARVNTQSRPYSGPWPTAACQFDLARMLFVGSEPGNNLYNNTGDLAKQDEKGNYILLGRFGEHPGHAGS